MLGTMMKTVRFESQRPHREDDRLTDRQRGVLRSIVHEYVTSGRPVGSKLLSERYSMGFERARLAI